MVFNRSGEPGFTEADDPAGFWVGSDSFARHHRMTTVAFEFVRCGLVVGGAVALGCLASRAVGGLSSPWETDPHRACLEAAPLPDQLSPEDVAKCHRATGEAVLLGSGHH
jgi:hypothetical protein